MFIMKKAITAALAAIVTLGMFTASASAKDYEIGDNVTFGTYEQDNNRKDGAEDIQWIVLDKQDGRLMLISRYCLDSKPYNDTLEATNWEYCSLRQWLNEDFYNAAFTEEEQERIFVETNENPEHDPYKTSSGRTTVDRVSVLSQEEANSRFTTVTERMSAPTAYAKAHGAYLNPKTKTAWWWLRTTSYLNDHVTYTTSLGGVSVNGREVTRQDAGVRPVIWITVE